MRKKKSRMASWQENVCLLPGYYGKGNISKFFKTVWKSDLIGSCRVSRVNCRGFRKLSRVRKRDNVIGACRVSRVNCRGSRVNCRGFRKLSRVRKIEFLLFPTFPKTISITIALELADNKFLAYLIMSDLIRKDPCDEDNIAELLKNMIRREAQIPTIATNASVS